MASRTGTTLTCSASAMVESTRRYPGSFSRLRIVSRIHAYACSALERLAVCVGIRLRNIPSWVRHRVGLEVRLVGLLVLARWWEKPIQAFALGHASCYPLILVFLLQGCIHNLFCDIPWDNKNTIIIANDDVTRLYGNSTAGNGDIGIPWHVLAAENRRVWALAKDWQANALYFFIIAHRTVGDHARCLIGLGTQRQDIAQGASFACAAGFDDDNFIFAYGVKDCLLLIESTAVCLK